MQPLATNQIQAIVTPVTGIINVPTKFHTSRLHHNHLQKTKGKTKRERKSNANERHVRSRPVSIRIILSVSDVVCANVRPPKRCRPRHQPGPIALVASQKFPFKRFLSRPSDKHQSILIKLNTDKRPDRTSPCHKQKKKRLCLRVSQSVRFFVSHRGIFCVCYCHTVRFSCRVEHAHHFIMPFSSQYLFFPGMQKLFPYFFCFGFCVCVSIDP